jgi:hypothetical protein
MMDMLPLEKMMEQELSLDVLLLLELPTFNKLTNTAVTTGITCGSGYFKSSAVIK